MSSDCPAPDALAGFLGSGQGAEERRRVEEHLDRCSDCRKIVYAAMSGEATAVERPVSELTAIGDRIGRFEVREQLGAGGMGVVYKCFDPMLDRLIAVKVVRAYAGTDGQPAAELRLLREARALARLDHRNIVSVYDAGFDGAALYVAMELIDGVDLRAWAREEARTSSEIKTVFAQAARGLSAAHSAGLVHRDFKLTNVMVTRDGRVVVLDFGLARSGRFDAGDDDETELIGTDVTQTGAFVGTPAYSSPEQLDGEAATAQSDIFSFTVSLYEALFRKRPFSGDSVVVLRDAVREGAFQIPETPRIGKTLETLIRKGLSVDPRDRPASLLPMIRALEPPRRRVGLAVGAAVCLVALAGAALFTTMRAGDSGCDVSRDTSSVWNQARRSQLEATLGEAFAVGPIERALGRWVDTRDRACSEPVLDRRVARQRDGCLRRALDEIDTSLDVLARNPKLASEASDIIDAPSLMLCTDPRTLGVLSPVPSSPIAAVQARVLERTVAFANAHYRAGLYKNGLEIAKEAAARARDSSAHAAALTTVGFLQDALRDPAAEPTLKQARSLAAEAGNSYLEASTEVELALLASGRGRNELASDRLARARSIISRVGSPPQFVSRESVVTAAIGYDLFRFDAAGDAIKRGLAATDALQGSGIDKRLWTHHRVRLLSISSQLASMRNDDEETVRLARAAMALAESVYGPSSMTLATPGEYLANALAAQGKSGEADVVRKRVAALYEGSSAPVDLYYAALADAQAAAGARNHAAEVSHTATAVSIARSRFGRNHTLTFDADVALATALYKAGRFDDSLSAVGLARAKGTKIFGDVSDLMLPPLMLSVQIEAARDRLPQAVVAHAQLEAFTRKLPDEMRTIYLPLVRAYRADLFLREGKHEDAYALIVELAPELEGNPMLSGGLEHYSAAMTLRAEIAVGRKPREAIAEVRRHRDLYAKSAALDRYDLQSLDEWIRSVESAK